MVLLAFSPWWANNSLLVKCLLCNKPSIAGWWRQIGRSTREKEHFFFRWSFIKEKINQQVTIDPDSLYSSARWEIDFWIEKSALPAARPHATQGNPRGVLRLAGLAYTVLEKQIRRMSGIVTLCVVWSCLSFGVYLQRIQVTACVWFCVIYSWLTRFNITIWLSVFTQTHGMRFGECRTWRK